VTRALPRKSAAADPAVDNVRGALCILVSGVLFTAMAAMAKFLGQRLPSIEIAFARSILGFLLVLPFAMRAGPAVWRTTRLHLHVTRGTLGSCGMICGFYAVTHLPLAEATALSFTKPLFQVLLAAFVLRELVRGERWVATAIGFLGVLVMLGPAAGQGVLSLAALVGLAGAVFAALVSITLRHMVQIERELTILVYLGIVGSIVTGIPTAFVWVTPTLGEFALMLLMSAVGMISQLFMMRGFRLGEASAMAPFDYARLPISALWGFLFFAELPGMATVAGALVIAGSTLWIARREAQQRRLGTRPGG
jgi:drug/metabolite transporter (DMT)-like permease